MPVASVQYQEKRNHRQELTDDIFNKNKELNEMYHEMKKALWYLNLLFMIAFPEICSSSQST